MKLFFKVIILFLIVFNFKIPYFYNSVIFADVLVVIYYIFGEKRIPATYFFNRYTVIILMGTVLISFIDLAFTVLHGEYYFLHQKRLILQFFMLASFVFALPLFIGEKENEALETMSAVVCYTFALQGLIHLAGFLHMPLGEWILSLKPEGFINFIENPEYNIDRFRGYALAGSIFFELPAAYGVACIVFFRLQLIKNQKYIFGITAYIVLFFLIAGISLSGRTGFVGLFVGLFLYCFYSLRKLYSFSKSIWKVLLGIMLALVFFYLLLPNEQRNALENEVFPFAFEAYYNFKEQGVITTSSTDALIQGHYFALENETLLAGHGISSEGVSLYRYTDAGYMNALIFGGILYLLALLIYQYLYFASPLYIVRRLDTDEHRRDFMYFLLLFVYMLILEYKASALGTQHITEVLFFAAGSTYMIRHYYRLEHG
jgi:hypothetical protein